MKITFTTFKYSMLASKNAINSLLTELTENTDILALREDEGVYEVRTALSAVQVNDLAHKYLNDIGDETGGWMQRGNWRSLRRYLIRRVTVK